MNDIWGFLTGVSLQLGATLIFFNTLAYQRAMEKEQHSTTVLLNTIKRNQK